MTFTAHDSVLGAQAHATVGSDLQATLVELIALSLIGKQLHWNIVGPGFRGLHLQLDELVDSWRELLDVVAERQSAIGVPPDGRPAVVLECGVGSVEPGPIEVDNAVRSLSGRIADVAQRVLVRLRRIGELDLPSQDVLIEVSRALEHQRWLGPTAQPCPGAPCRPDDRRGIRHGCGS
jgi:starvation-inducible DNA-binding protein